LRLSVHRGMQSLMKGESNRRAKEVRSEFFLGQTGRGRARDGFRLVSGRKGVRRGRFERTLELCLGAAERAVDEVAVVLSGRLEYLPHGQSVCLRLT
jgi:hypothetical protein